jgi:hypothetical protein
LLLPRINEIDWSLFRSNVLTIAVNFDAVAKGASFSLYLDTVMEELFEIGTVEDTVRCRFRIVNDKLVLGSVLCGSGFGLQKG